MSHYPQILSLPGARDVVIAIQSENQPTWWGAEISPLLPLETWGMASKGFDILGIEGAIGSLSIEELKEIPWCPR